MGTLELKNTALELLQKTEDNNLLKTIVDLLSKSKEDDFFDEMPSEVQNKLLKSIEQADNGELIPFEQMMKELA